MLHSTLKLTLLTSTFLISQSGVAATPDTKGMTLWLDATESNTLFSDKACSTPSTAIANGVKCWKDKSVKKNDVKLAPNRTEAPLLEADSNGKPVIAFSETALVTDNVGQITPKTSYTKFVVFKVNDALGGVGENAKHNLIGSDPFETTLWANSGKIHSTHKGSTTNYLDSDKALGITKYHIAATRYSRPDYDPSKPNDALSNILNLDGKREDHNKNEDNNIDFPPKPARTSIGGVGSGGDGNSYFYLNGSIAEAMIYDRALSDAEIISIEQYLAKKWNLALGQNITFEQPKNQVVKSTDIQLHATASSGLPVTFSSTTKDVCTITSGGKYVSLGKTGTCKINANQKGDDTYPKAATVLRSFEIKKKADETTEQPPASDTGSGGGAPLPLGLVIIGLISFLRRRQ